MGKMILLHDDLMLIAEGYAEQYINGNRNLVCVDILNGKRPEVMAALVAIDLTNRMQHLGYEFTRLLDMNLLEFWRVKNEPN